MKSLKEREKEIEEFEGVVRPDGFVYRGGQWLSPETAKKEDIEYEANKESIDDVQKCTEISKILDVCAKRTDGKHIGGVSPGSIRGDCTEAIKQISEVLLEGPKIFSSIEDTEKVADMLSKEELMDALMSNRNTTKQKLAALAELVCRLLEGREGYLGDGQDEAIRREENKSINYGKENGNC